MLSKLNTAFSFVSMSTGHVGKLASAQMKNNSDVSLFVLRFFSSKEITANEGKCGEGKCGEGKCGSK